MENRFSSAKTVPEEIEESFLCQKVLRESIISNY